MREWLRTWSERLLSFIEKPVPPEVEVCEFHCRKLECSQGEWEHCERRRAHLSTANSTSHPPLQ